MNALFIRQQRWLANATFLCQLVDANNSQANPMRISIVIDQAITQLLQDCAAFTRSSADLMHEHELQDYIKEVRGGDPVINGQPGAQGNWSPTPDERYLNKQILFEMESLSPLAQKVAQILNRNQPESIQVQVNDGGNLVAQQVSDSLLFKMLKLAYLNRKVAMMAENVFSDNHQLAGPADLQNPLFLVFDANQRVRCATFSTPFSRSLAMDYVDKPFSGLKAAYAKIQNEENRPFSKQVHRRRRPRADKVEDYHPESKTLALNAGAALFQPLPNESTLGYIESLLGLPERSDISGTNTDAVGFANTLNYDNVPEGINIKRYRSRYLLTTMTTMSLVGHHSLSETAAAASLWSSANYKPFDPASVINVLSNLYNLDGNPIVAADEVLASNNDDVTWIRNKWEALKLDRMTPDDLEFNDGLWWAVKSTLSDMRSSVL